MKMNELRDLSVADLAKEYQASLREQFNLRMQQGSGQAPKPHLFKVIRRKIARIKTLLCEQKRTAKQS